MSVLYAMNPWDFRSPKGKPHAVEDYEIPIIDLAGPIGQHSGDIEVQAETDEFLVLEPAGMRHGNAQCGVFPDNIPDA